MEFLDNGKDNRHGGYLNMYRQMLIVLQFLLFNAIYVVIMSDILHIAESQRPHPITINKVPWQWQKWLLW